MEHPLRLYRSRHALTLPALSERTGIPKSVLSRIESRTTAQPRISTIKRIMEATDGEIRESDFTPHVREAS